MSPESVNGLKNTMTVTESLSYSEFKNFVQNVNTENTFLSIGLPNQEVEDLS